MRKSTIVIAGLVAGALLVYGFLGLQRLTYHSFAGWKSAHILHKLPVSSKEKYTSDEQGESALHEKMDTSKQQGEGNTLQRDSTSTPPIFTPFQKKICSRFSSTPSVWNVDSSSPKSGYRDDFTASAPAAINNSSSASRIRVLGIKDSNGHNELMCHGAMFSAALNNIPMELYGASPYFDGMNGGYWAKLDRLLAVLCAFDPADVVLMVDAFDVIFMRPMEEIEFLYFHKWQSPNLVISTEGNCFPDKEYLCSPKYLPTPPPSAVKFINSGVIIAKVPTYIELLAIALDRYTSKPDGHYSGGDQHLLAELVYEGYKEHGYFLDFGSELSASTHPPATGFADIHVGGRNYFVNLDSKSVPMLVHLNGGSSKDLIKPKERMWYFNGKGKLKSEVAEQVKSYPIWVDGIQRSVSDLCRSET